MQPVTFLMPVWQAAQLAMAAAAIAAAGELIVVWWSGATWVTGGLAPWRAPREVDAVRRAMDARLVVAAIARCYGTRSPLDKITRIIGFTLKVPDAAYRIGPLDIGAPASPRCCNPWDFSV